MALSSAAASVETPAASRAAGPHAAGMMRGPDSRTAFLTGKAEPAVHAVRSAPAVYEEDVEAGGLFRLGEFVFRNGGDDDVVEYQYGFGSVIDRSVDAAGDHRGRSARVEFRPDRAGAITLAVRGVDASGGLGPIRDYHLRVAYAAESGRWNFEEGSGFTAEAEGRIDNDLSLSPTTTWIDGLADFALHFDDQTDRAVSDASVIRSRHRFTATAWVRLDSLASTGVAVSQDGKHRSGFSLGYTSDDAVCAHSPAATERAGCFAMWAPGSDSQDAASAVATSPEPVVSGDWYVLIGVYNDDAPAGEQLRVYSCNTTGFDFETGATDRPDGWRAGGPLRIGQGDVHGTAVDPWLGDVDSVTVYRGALDEGGVRAKCGGAA